MLPKEKLKCPICGRISETYKEHFEHWSSHYRSAELKEEQITPLDHTGAVRYYKSHPRQIEEGLRVIESEVWLFRGRIDLIGIDKSNNLVIVDITGGKDENRKIQQLQKYRKYIFWIGRHIYGLDMQMPIRLLIVRIGGEVKEIPTLNIEFSNQTKKG